MFTMKATKTFKFALDGNTVTTFMPGDDIPEIAQLYAEKNGFSEKSKPAPTNKARKAPQNKAR